MQAVERILVTLVEIESSRAERVLAAAIHPIGVEPGAHVALLARSTQFEKEDVTAEQPVWNLGKAVAVTGADDCDGAKCLTIKIDHLPDWKRYRYRLFETIVPLRNMVWSS